MKESQLDNKTAIATNDYVRMVDENGNSVKIKKDSFMAAIRDALPSIISDGETGGGSVLSIINGALKTRTDANLASVLDVPNFKTIIESQGESIDDIDETGWFFVYGSPNGLGYTLVHPGAKDYRMQFRNTETNSEFKVRTMEHGTWSSWKRCDNFGANTPAELASLLGVSKGSISVPANGTNTITKPGTGILIVKNYSANAKTALFTINKDNITPLTTGGIENIVSADQNNISISNPFSNQTIFNYIIIS